MNENENKIEFLSIKEIEYKDDYSVDADATNFDRVSYALVDFNINDEHFADIMVQGSQPYGISGSQYWEISKESGNPENEKFFDYINEKELDVDALESGAKLHNLVDEEVKDFFEQEDQFLQDEITAGSYSDEVKDFFAEGRAKDFGLTTEAVVNDWVDLDRVAADISDTLIDEAKDYSSKNNLAPLSLIETKNIEFSAQTLTYEEAERLEKAASEDKSLEEKNELDADRIYNNFTVSAVRVTNYDGQQSFKASEADYLRFKIDGKEDTFLYEESNITDDVADALGIKDISAENKEYLKEVLDSELANKLGDTYSANKQVDFAREVDSSFESVLAQSNNDYVKLNLADRTNNPDILKKLVNDKSDVFRSDLAHSTERPEIRDAMLNDKSIDVQKAISLKGTDEQRGVIAANDLAELKGLDLQSSDAAEALDNIREKHTAGNEKKPIVFTAETIQNNTTLKSALAWTKGASQAKDGSVTVPSKVEVKTKSEMKASVKEAHAAKASEKDSGAEVG